MKTLSGMLLNSTEKNLKLSKFVQIDMSQCFVLEMKYHRSVTTASFLRNLKKKKETQQIRFKQKQEEEKWKSLKVKEANPKFDVY